MNPAVAVTFNFTLSVYYHNSPIVSGHGDSAQSRPFWTIQRIKRIVSICGGCATNAERREPVCVVVLVSCGCPVDGLLNYVSIIIVYERGSNKFFSDTLDV